MEKLTTIRVAVLLLALVAGGCKSHVQSAAERVGRVMELATDSRDHALALSKEAEMGPVPAETVTTHANAIVDAQTEIVAAGKSVLTKDIPHLEDKTPYWARLLRTWGFVAGVGVVLALLIYLGVGKVVRPILQRVGMLVPKAVDAAAKLDAEAIVEGVASEVQHRVVTARRVAEPLYNRLFQKHKAEAERQKGSQ